MCQRFYNLIPADSFAGNDQDRVVTGNRSQYFMGRMRIDVRSDSHRISRTGLDNCQVTRKLKCLDDVASALSLVA